MIMVGKSLAALATLGLMAATPAIAQTRSAESLPSAEIARCVDSDRLLRNSAGESLGPAPVDTTLRSCAQRAARARGSSGGVSPAILVGGAAIIAAIVAVAGGGGGGNDSPG